MLNEGMGIDLVQERAGDDGVEWKHVGDTVGGHQTEKGVCKNMLRCFYFNAHSLRNKKDELFSYIVEEGLDLVCITESWVNESQFNDSHREMGILYILVNIRRHLHLCLKFHSL